MLNSSSRRKRPRNDIQTWRMRWSILIFLMIAFLISLIVVAITQKMILVSLPSSLLPPIMFIVRGLFSANGTRPPLSGKPAISLRKNATKKPKKTPTRKRSAGTTHQPSQDSQT